MFSLTKIQYSSSYLTKLVKGIKVLVKSKGEYYLSICTTDPERAAGGREDPVYQGCDVLDRRPDGDLK